MSPRSQRTGQLVNISNEELARIERENNRNRRRNMAGLNDQHIGLGNEPHFPVDDAQNAANAAAAAGGFQQPIPAPGQRQPQPRPIGAIDTPHAFYHNRSAIQPPPINRQDYEIKPQTIALVRQSMFYGLPSESPMDHIETLEDIFSMTRANGVPADFFRCKLFGFSMGDKALRWLKSLPPGSITSWEQCRALFLDSFYTKHKTANLRAKITNFQQHASEPMSEAWARFKEYQRECPHHGYSNEHILNIFYDGVSWNVKNSLNAASNGDFMTRTVEEAFTLIENLASSSSNQTEEYDRSRKSSVSDSKKLEEMSAKIDMLMQKDQRVVSSIEESGEGAFCNAFSSLEQEEPQAEVNYVGGQNFGQNRGYNPNFQQNFGQNQGPRFQQGYQNPPQQQAYQAPAQNRPYGQGFGQNRPFGQSMGQNRFQNQNFSNNQPGYQQKQPFNSFQSKNQAQVQVGESSVPASQESKLESMIQQLMLNQQKTSTEINSKVDNINVKVDSMYQDMNNK